MGYITFNGIGEDTYSLSIKNIVRSVAPPVINRLATLGNSDGSIYYGASLGNRQIVITFQMTQEMSKTELHTLIPSISAWLFPYDRVAKALTISDEAGIRYYAQVDGSTDINELFVYGEFAVTFVCTDPYKYATSPSTIANVNATPTFKTSQLPVITATFTGSATGYTITENTSGKAVVITGSFVNTDIVVVDCKNRTITKNGTSIITQLDFINTRWIELLPTGYNLTDSSANATFATVITQRYQ